MKAGTSEEAVKAGTGTRTNASVVYNGYNIKSKHVMWSKTVTSVGKSTYLLVI